MLLQDPKNEADDLDDFTEPNKVDCEPLVDSSSSSLIFTIFLKQFSHFFISYSILFFGDLNLTQKKNKLAPIVFLSALLSQSHHTHSSCSAYLKAAQLALVLFMKTKGPPLSSVFCRCLDHPVFQMAAAS